MNLFYLWLERVTLGHSIIHYCTEIYKFKAKDSEIVATPLCLGNISKDWSTDNMKKTGFDGYVYDFSIDYDATDIDDINNIHKYLMKNNNVNENI